MTCSTKPVSPQLDPEQFASRVGRDRGLRSIQACIETPLVRGEAGFVGQPKVMMTRMDRRRVLGPTSAREWTTHRGNGSYLGTLLFQARKRQDLRADVTEIFLGND
jgi:hypothetical protein